MKKLHITGVVFISLISMGPLKDIIYPTYTNVVNIPIVDNVKVLTDEEIKEIKVEESINNNKSVYEFYSNMFGISMDTLKQELLNNEDIDNTDIEILNFIENLKAEKPELFNSKYEYINNNKEYIYGLIDYFCSIYTNVDNKIAKAISMVETGNLGASSMLKNNNIYGGMSSGKLIKYNNIEYGVYKYIKLLSNNYFGMGLNTIESIGYKYNPTLTENGKVANPTWVSNVYMYYNKLSNSNINSIEELLKLK